METQGIEEQLHAIIKNNIRGELTGDVEWCSGIYGIKRASELCTTHSVGLIIGAFVWYRLQDDKETLTAEELIIKYIEYLNLGWNETKA